MDWKEIEKISTEEAMTGATLGIVRPELEKMGEATGTGQSQKYCQL